jgi:hypothetical protein
LCSGNPEYSNPKIAKIAGLTPVSFPHFDRAVREGFMAFPPHNSLC